MDPKYRMRRCARPATAMVAALGVWLAAGSASARIETLEWAHPGTDSAGNPVEFRLYLGSSPSSVGAAQVLQVSSPSPGVFRYLLDVPDTATMYVQVSAHSTVADSQRSSQRPLYPPIPDLDGNGPLLFSPGDYSSSSGAPLWYDTVAGNSMQRDDSLFDIDTTNGILSTTSPDINIHSHVVTTSSGTWSNYEYRGRMLISGSSSGIGVTVGSDYPNSDSYYRLRRYGTGGFTLSSHPDGNGYQTVTCSKSATGVTPAANTWYRFRMQMVVESSRTLIRARVWRDGAAEPTDWPVDCSDARSTRLTEGTVGVWAMGSGTKSWDSLEVADLNAPPASPDPDPTPLVPPGAPQLLP